METFIKHRIDLNKLLPKNPITVELGVAESLFSRDIMKAWRPSLHYLVDAWQTIPNITGDGASDQDWHDKNYENVIKLMKPFEGSYKILRGITWEMARLVPYSSVDLVYIDACHSYECVKKDIESWLSRVKIGGIMAFHDYMSDDYGVKQAVEQFCRSMNYEVNLIPELKAEDAGAWFRVGQ